MEVASRYNLKRRVASLPPLSSEIFAEKVISAQATSSAAAAKASFEITCTPCQKTYYSENAYQNHIGSQKHRSHLNATQHGDMEIVDDGASSPLSSTVSLGAPIGMASMPSQGREAEAEISKIADSIKETTLEEQNLSPSQHSAPLHSPNHNLLNHPNVPELITVTSILSKPDVEIDAADKQLLKCLFCNYNSPTFKLNVMHMTKHHGMFIPEQAYLVDLEGLIGYLHSKITENNECLLCHKIKGSVTGVQTHMRDKGHCMIGFDTEEELIEVGQFYDFSSTYSDNEDDDTDMDDARAAPSGGVKLDSQGLETIDQKSSGGNDKPEGDENADGWETDSSASSLDSEDLHAIPIDHDHAFERLPLHRHHSHNDPRPHKTIDGFHSHAHNHHAVFHSDYELHLPSGRTAGHRSLARYYRQNLHSYPTSEERIERRLLADSPAEDENDSSHGNRGRQVATRTNGGMLGVTDAKKREVRAVEKRDTKRVQRAQKQYQWGVDKRGNNQKHFRDPLLQ